MKALGAAVAILWAACVTAGGCKTELHAYTCLNPDKGHVDAQGEPDPCHEHDPAACGGQCAPLPPFDWSQPALLWVGVLEEAPPCPENAPVYGYEGYAGFSELPFECPACECEPPVVTCELPPVWTVGNTACSAPPMVTTSFNPPASWDGTCTSANAIPANATCGAQPCVQSITIEPPVVESSPCSPKVPDPEPVPKEVPFSSFGRACMGEAYPPCPSAGETCAPAQPEGFKTCIFQRGDVACPDPWTEKYVFYEGLGDQRDCTACTCGDPVGSTCTAAVSLYTDGLCSMPLFQNLMIGSLPACIDLVPGSAVGSKEAILFEPQPGACSPTGGEPIGSVEGNQPATFCCLPGSEI